MPNQRETAIALLAVASVFSGCASVPPEPAAEEVVEGNVSSYPAFESAARGCAFTALRKVSNGQGSTHYLVRFTYPLGPSEHCLVVWLSDHPELGLYRSVH